MAKKVSKDWSACRTGDQLLSIHYFTTLRKFADLWPVSVLIPTQIPVTFKQIKIEYWTSYFKTHPTLWLSPLFFFSLCAPLSPLALPLSSHPSWLFQLSLFSLPLLCLSFSPFCLAFSLTDYTIRELSSVPSSQQMQAKKVMLLKRNPSASC